MRAAIVVIAAPSAKRQARMGEVIEDLFIEELVAQESVEAFDEGVLHRLAGRDIMPANASVVLPIEHCAAGQLCPIVTDDHLRLAVEPDERVELAGNAQTRD